FIGPSSRAPSFRGWMRLAPAIQPAITPEETLPALPLNPRNPRNLTQFQRLWSCARTSRQGTEPHIRLSVQLINSALIPDSGRFCLDRGPLRGSFLALVEGHDVFRQKVVEHGADGGDDSEF